MASASCTFGTGSDSAESTTTTTEAVGSTAPQSTVDSSEDEPDVNLLELLGPDDRIVIQSSDNNLSILTAGGAIDGPTNFDATHPVFSPDGSILVWTIVAPDAGALATAAVGADGALEAPSVTPTPVLSFFNSFAPGGSDRVAVLGNTSRGVSIAIVDDGSPSGPVLDAGNPYFFAWNADGTGVIVHSGNELRAVEIESGGVRNLLQVAPTFGAPTLLGDGSALYVAVRNEVNEAGFSSLVRVPVEQDVPVIDGGERVLGFDGYATLTMAPGSGRLAMAVRGATEPETQNVALRQADGQVYGPGLHLLSTDASTDGGDIETLRTDQVLAAHWSPDGSRIASMGPTEGGNAVAWAIHDIASGDLISTTPPFNIGQTFGAAYLPFFDQFEQSISLWSPDNTRLAYPVQDDGRSLIVLHSLPATSDAEATTSVIADGVMAVWSP